jgi:tetratricopeptide (TPR) repeat protein
MNVKAIGARRIHPIFCALLTMAAACVFALPCRAQLIVLKSGQTAPAKNLKRDKQTVLTTIEVAGQAGQTGYAASDIDHLELPKPPQLDQAEQAILTGKPAAALPLLEPVIATYFPLRDLKGNYWAQAALLKSSALEALNKLDEATVLLTLLSEYGIDKTVALTAKARLAGLLALGGKSKAGQAISLADTILASSEDGAVLGEAWLAKGRALFTKDDYEGALLAYLHLPVFYSDNPTATAQALLGSGRSYLALQDTKRAARTFLELQQQYSASPEAAEAKKEIEKGGAAMAKQVKEIQAAQAEAEKKLQAAAGKS